MPFELVPDRYLLPLVFGGEQNLGGAAFIDDAGLLSLYRRGGDTRWQRCNPDHCSTSVSRALKV